MLSKWLWSYLKILGWWYSSVIIGNCCVFSWQPFNIYVTLYNLYLPMCYKLTPTFAFSLHDGDLLHNICYTLEPVKNIFICFSYTNIWTNKYCKLYQISVDKKYQLDVTFCIIYFSSNSCWTCFGQPCAHHQKLTTAWCYSLVLVCAVAAGRLSSPVGR